MRTRRFIGFLIALLGLLSPAMLFAGTGTIDTTDDQSYLCSNTDCSSHTPVFWRTTHGPAVTVTDTDLSGYIWSSELGWINLAPAHGGVHNTTSGTLSGYAWGSSAGWVNFRPAHGGVSIDPTTGEFSGWAWVAGSGWMRFGCSTFSPCLKTDWRPTATSSGGGGGGGGGGDITPPPPPPPPVCEDTNATNYQGSLPCHYPSLCTDNTATNFNQPGQCVYPKPLCTDPTATNFGGALPCEHTASCQDSAATNFNQAGKCVYPPAVCEDVSATNYHSALPCTYTQKTGIGTGDTGSGGGSTGTGGGSTGTGGGSGGIIGTTTSGGVCPKGTATGVIGSVLNQVQGTYCQTKQVGSTTIGVVRGIFQSKKGDTAAATAATVGVVASASFTVASLLFVNPLSFSEIFLIPARLWSLFLAALGLKKRRRPWGTVYDSITKQPLDPAYVTLRNTEGVDVTSSITDLDGRFGFVVPEPGTYAVVAHKTNYQFPSQKLVGRDHDELYRDLYFGEYFRVENAGDVVIKNIPMDPEHFDWNEFAKRQQSLMKFYSRRDKVLRRLSDIFFVIGFVVAALAVVFAPKTYNIIVLALYIVLFIIRRHSSHSRPYGDIVDVATGTPLSFALIRVSNTATGVEVMHRIADAQGRYYALLPNGEYSVRIDKKLPDGTYQTVVSDMKATVTKGYLSQKFKL